MFQEYKENYEYIKSISDTRLENVEQEIVQSGELIIDKSEDLGINDPLTHLFLYINHGEKSLIGIRQDIETDVAERLPKTPFINCVGFELENNDFLSIEDRVSMRGMSTTNLDILSTELKNNINLRQEYDRAIIEAKEVDKLTAWFKDAPINSFLVFESLPIGNQEIAISRIYKKVSEDYLEGSFLSLYNPSIIQFTKFREKIGIKKHNYYKDELEVLASNYSFYDPNVESTYDFINYYVEAYDSILGGRLGIKTSFGLDTDINTDRQNGVEKVRQHPKLTDVYLNAIKAISNGKGTVTADLITICDRLHIDNYLLLNDRITTDNARNLLKNIIMGITGVIDKANNQLLADLENCNDDSSAFYGAVSHYSDVAARSGESYPSLGCPEISRNEALSSDDEQSSEYSSMFKAYGVYENLNNFGRPKIDICIINNCPSHGQGIFPEKTLVGGCGICVHCHKILQRGSSPEAAHDQDNHEKKKKAQIDKMKITKLLMKKLDDKEREKRRNLIKKAGIIKGLKPKDRQLENDDDEIKKLKQDIKKVA